MNINLEELIEKGEIVFLSYTDFSQPLISFFVEALERIGEESENLNFPQKLYIVFIEVAQNIMNYAEKGNFKAFILVGKEEDSYYVLSKNLISKAGKEKVEERLEEIKGLDRKEIRKLYKERRKSGANTHEKGGGIGFLEIAKASKKIEYHFEPFEEDKYIFTFKAYV